MRNKILILFALIFVVASCKEEPIGQQPIDGTAPGQVTNIVPRNIPGGAVLKYNLPIDEDLLYIKATFLRNGELVETKASVYTDTLVIEGFGDTNPREVTLIAVDRSKNESAANTVTINPLTPPVTTITESLQLLPDFGGVHAYWENKTRAEISVTILKKDHNGEYVPHETFWSTTKDGDAASRGMDTLLGEFGVFVEDRWGNQGTVLYEDIIPFYETIFDRAKFAAIDLPGDAGAVSGWAKNRMWNGTKGAEEGYSSPGGLGTWPHSVTIDLGVQGLISRVRIYQRAGNGDEHIFAEGNPRFFKVYGCAEGQLNTNDGGWGQWTLLMDCESIKPSGLPFGQKDAEDMIRGKEGEDFINSPTNPPVRYLRLLVTQTWAGGDNFQIGEIEIFGDNR